MALNNVSIMGRLTRSPELRTVGEDIPVVSFGIAVDHDRKGKDGERGADFFNVTAWRGLGKMIAQYFDTGDMIVIRGRLQSRNYTDKEGNNRTAVDILAEDAYFGSTKKEGGNNQTATKPSGRQAAYDTDDGDLPW